MKLEKWHWVVMLHKKSQNSKILGKFSALKEECKKLLLQEYDVDGKSLKI